LSENKRTPILQPPVWCPENGDVYSWPVQMNGYMVWLVIYNPSEIPEAYASPKTLDKHGKKTDN